MHFVQSLFWSLAKSPQLCFSQCILAERASNLWRLVPLYRGNQTLRNTWARWDLSLNKVFKKSDGGWKTCNAKWLASKTPSLLKVQFYKMSTPSFAVFSSLPSQGKKTLLQKVSCRWKIHLSFAFRASQASCARMTVVPVPICARRDSSDSSGRSTESTGRKVKDSKHRRKTNRTNPPKAKGRVSHASTLDELEAQTAKDLLVRKQSSHTLQSIQEAKEASLDESDHFEENEYTRASSAVSKSRTNSKSKRVGANKTSGSDKNAILGKCQRMSLDELRENHDAAMCVNQSYSNKTAQERESTQVSRTSSSMPPAAKLWLQLLCILPLQYRWLGHFWTLCVFLILLAPTTLLAWLLVEDVHTIMTSTVLCYLVGVIAATWSLRRANIQELLGSSEGSMEQRPPRRSSLFFLLFIFLLCKVFLFPFTFLAKTIV